MKGLLNLFQTYKLTIFGLFFSFIQQYAEGFCIQKTQIHKLNKINSLFYNKFKSSLLNII
jgi:hypothetical protein